MPYLSQITLSHSEDDVIDYVIQAIKDGEAGKKDINVIVNYHINMLDKAEVKSVSEYQTRIWILNNICRILEGKHLDINISLLVEEELIGIDWVITALVELYQTIHLDIGKIARRRKFAVQLRKVMIAEIYLGNKAIGTKCNLIDVIKLLKVTDDLC